LKIDLVNLCQEESHEQVISRLLELLA